MKKRVMKKRKTLENIMCNNNNHVDLISSLPEPILHHIISFLPTKDAVKTSALSRTWNSTWKSFPVMVFDQYSFQDSAYSRNRHRNIKNIVQDFCKHVDESIASRKGVVTSIEKFKVVVNSYGSSPSRRKYLDRWLNFAINNNVRDLVLANYYTTCRPKEGWHYVLPRSLFRALSSLEILDLFGCRFIEYSRLSDYYYYYGIGIFSLKNLRLSHVYIDQETLQSVVSHCCLLEELSIVSCKGFEVVRVSNCLKLKIVDLYLGRGSEVQIVSVLAPNLRSVSYGGGIASVRGSLMASEFYESLKELKLHDTDIKDDFFRVVIPELLIGHIEKLEINRCCLLESVRISSEGLLELSIMECVKLREIELDTSRLSHFRTDSGCDIRFQRSN